MIPKVDDAFCDLCEFEVPEYEQTVAALPLRQLRQMPYQKLKKINKI